MVLKRVLVTGAGGMTGRYMVDLALASGLEVVACGRSPVPDNLRSKVEWHTLDLAVWREPDALASLIGSVDAILHAAAAVPIGPRDFDFGTLFDAGPRAVAALGNWAFRKQIRLIYLSSCTVYRNTTNNRIHESDALQPSGPWQDYGMSKLMGEAILRSLDTAGLAWTILRPTSIYGAGMAREKLVAKWLDICQKGGVIRLQPPLNERLNIVYAADVARAALQAAEAGCTGTFNIGGPEMVAIRDIADACVAAAGRGSVEIHDAEMDASENSTITRFDVDDSAAHQAFGYRPEFHVRQGVADMARRTT